MQEASGSVCSDRGVGGVLGADFALFLAQRSRRQHQLRCLAKQEEENARWQCYALLNILHRLFGASKADRSDVQQERIVALRLAMTARADGGHSYYDVSLGFDPLHETTLTSIQKIEHLLQCKQFLCEQVLESKHLTLEYGDDTMARGRTGCSVRTRPFLKLSWSFFLNDENTKKEETVALALESWTPIIKEAISLTQTQQNPNQPQQNQKEKEKELQELGERKNQVEEKEKNVRESNDYQRNVEQWQKRRTTIREDNFFAMEASENINYRSWKSGKFVYNDEPEPTWQRLDQQDSSVYFY